MILTNKQKLHLSMAVFLAHDSYDHDSRPNAISATGLLNSVRQIVLAKRVTSSSSVDMDVSDFLASSVGTAVHDAIEAAWLHGNHVKALKRLGYSDSTLARIKINPEPSQLVEGDIPIYVEQRAEKEIDGYIVSGKYDFVGDGELTDHKTTGVYGYMQGNNDDKHRLQGSIYRWLNPEKITADHMTINYLFTDWSKLRATIEAGKGYPPQKSLTHKIKLLSLADTETYIRNKIASVIKHISLDEELLPLCTREELWQTAPTYKYYKDPTKKARSTRNFSSFIEAQTKLVTDGSTGVIDTVPGEARRCKYCAAINSCSQAKQLIAAGTLTLDS